eukprot:TRINITY_DN15305_c0_g1_i1.p1 TRINITY_DN15305_c0_g1~~TRINITY_DN15305_c0_g1_i1.p1  ORF type:complete len:321 (-),score=69.95 TRINITY_DN15305_c0_g1_i1:50-916(-)
MKVLFAVTLLIIASVASAEDMSVTFTGDAQQTCTFQGVDFTSLQSAGAFYFTQAGDSENGEAVSNDQWWISICTAVSTKVANGGTAPNAGCAKANTAACRFYKNQLENNGAPGFGFLKKNNKDYIQYRNGGACSKGGGKRNTTVQFVCDESVPLGKVVSAKESATTCAYDVVFSTSLKGICTGTAGSGGSTGGNTAGTGSNPGTGSSSTSSGTDWTNVWGWLIFIGIIVGFVLYIVLGGVYKFKVYEERGMEMVPNIEFWRGLPGILLDGCKYSIAIVTCKTSEYSVV